MVQRRQGFQRIYDLAERVLPDGVDTSRPSTEDYADYLIRRTLNAHGLATPQQIAYLRRGMAASVTKRLLELVEEDVVMPLTIGRGQVVYYAEAGLLSSAGIRVQNRMRILSPFDNCVIQRKRLSELWNYDYQIECYIPEPKRIYGYFCLPLLFGDHFVGRIDVKAERKSKLLHVRHVVKEHTMDDYLFVSELMAALESFMGFNGCTDIKIQRTSPGHLKSLFRAY